MQAIYKKKDETSLNSRLQNKQKRKQKEETVIFWGFVVEEKDRAMPRKELWGHYTSLGEA